jgi:hypothetical protein
MKYRNWFFEDQQGDGNDGGGAGSDGGAGAGNAGDKSAGASGDAGKGDGNAADKIWPDDWRTQIAGTDEKALKQLERYATPAEIWNKARSFEQRLSAGELKSALPKDATPEKIAAWRTENGIPAKPEEYDIADLKIPEEDKGIATAFLTSMHGVNAPPSVVKEGLKWYYGEVQRVNEELAAQDKEIATKTEDALRSEWGKEYRVNMNMVTGLIQSAPEAVRDEFLHGRLANGQPIMANAEVMKWLNGMARELNPITTIMPNSGGDFAGSVDTEIAAIEKTMKENRKAYNADEKLQARYRDLLDARQKLGNKK